MDASVHDDHELPIFTQSQPNPSTDSLDSTKPTTNKRRNPESPDTLPATEKQTKRQIRRRNSLNDLTELQTPATKKQTVQRKISQTRY